MWKNWVISKAASSPTRLQPRSTARTSGRELGQQCLCWEKNSVCNRTLMWSWRSFSCQGSWDFPAWDKITYKRISLIRQKLWKYHRESRVDRFPWQRQKLYLFWVPYTSFEYIWRDTNFYHQIMLPLISASHFEQLLLSFPQKCKEDKVRWIDG